MKSFPKSKGLLVIGEENIFKELSEIVSIALETNAIVKNMLKANYQNQILSGQLEEVRELERKSDKIAFKIGEDVTGGAISPNVIDNLLECIQTADNIVDLHYYISRELKRVSGTSSIDLETYHKALWEPVYQKLLDLADISLQNLQKMLCASRESEFSKFLREIEALEEEGDEVKDQGFDKLYNISSKIPYLQFYHYSELLHKCDDILDSCQDTSQLIVTIVASVLK
jgi:uncharacterized protein